MPIAWLYLYPVDRVTSTFANGPEADVPIERESQILTSELMNFVCHVAENNSPRNIVILADWSVNTHNGMTFTPM